MEGVYACEVDDNGTKHNEDYNNAHDSFQATNDGSSLFESLFNQFISLCVVFRKKL